ncbi:MULTISPECIES: HpcH/HpaI aldolase/citrate lyase family protein [Streptomyces]|uniref:HpcH/HpaI aldolase/citrate lyase family protein n=3 Tax=Streptomyces TaxID=1883 RepID=A0ABD5JFZ7_9ACTN|nr:MULTISPECIES: HpcH/HpaI aldolase/citrate lyase family protein [Streptomyces]MEE4586134.1 HpcH/HpaI aldolase/citrate lyase family protein [Streptomyces sp. DSM 41602]AJZ85500.1 HpcH/HpaI aldolase/citrate lyase family protein [Streptomyces sp. AgN23]KUL48612.1 ATP/GTP-binding protein [Streptomyces violaceusniger]RSS30502.1 ATP/GTP-binding protein [Streptomyces sp. WAC05858]WJD99867.1 HpcH/HpaI aldolase/citrate lyase family protein [Streptomyces antimycoticus]
MRHFEHLPAEVRASVFHREPVEFSVDSPARTLAVALGATLYCPATRPKLAEDIVRQAGRGVVSMVLCLEDSIDDAEVPGAEENLIRQLAELSGLGPGTPLPLLFIRVRTPEQIVDLLARLGAGVRLLSGFVLPKFTEERGGAFLEALMSAENAQVTEALGGRRLFAMPVLESPELMHRETRTDTLSGISRIVDKYRERVLALRLGVTDLCSAYGLRRAPDMTAYDVQLIASVIADVVNMLGRADGTGFTITGPVWEYFKPHERMFKPQLRISPFSSGRAESLRTTLIEHHMDGLLREIELDRANGLQGKTCIHPTHVAPVHALSVVSHEEFSDAVDILEPQRCGGGVLRSSYTNKMNEVKPHRAWAERTLQRAEVFGVAREDVSFVELLAASLRT